MIPLLLAIVIARGEVTPNTRYEFEFEAGTRGVHTTAAYPYITETTLDNAWARSHLGCPVPYYEVVFRNAEGRRFGSDFAIGNHWSVLIREERLKYGAEFTAPPGAVCAELLLNVPDKRDTVLVTNAVFRTVAEPAALNVNPTFERGENDYSGWSAGRDRVIRPDPLNPGRFMLVCGNRFTGGSVWTDWIPVEPGARYRLEYNFQRTPDLVEGNSRVLFMLYKDPSVPVDRWSGTLSKTLAGGQDAKDGAYEFTIPEGMHVLRSLIENTTIRRYALFREDAE